MSGRHGIQNPRHPSLDNLRRRGPQSRSFPQLPDSSGSNEYRTRVRFPEEEEEPGTSIGLLETLSTCITAVLAAVCTGGVLTILIVLYLTVRPFSTSVYRRLSSQIGISSFLDAIALLLPNTRIFLSGDSDIPSPVGTSILVSNHLIDGDWWSILMLGRCIGLRGTIKIFLRNEVLQLNKQQHHFASERSASSTTAAASTNNAAARMSVSSTTSLATTVSSAGEQTTNANTPNIANPATTAGSNTARHPHCTMSPDITLAARLLSTFVEFPLLSEEDYISGREGLFSMLRSFADNDGSGAPVQLLLFPEGWSIHNGADRRSVLAKSNEFAKRENRPQFKHLLLPRTSGFYASLTCLRDSSPVVYDITMAYRGYNGSVPPRIHLSLGSLWSFLRQGFPSEVHICIKRFSIEEVLSDPSWLDKQWKEKDRLLSHFSRHQSFPTDGRGFCRHRVFDSRYHSMESSAVALGRLMLVPCAVPILLFLSIPLFWSVSCIWVVYRSFAWLFPGSGQGSSATGDAAGRSGTVSETPTSVGLDSQPTTPFVPATPFASPSVSNWRDMLNNQGDYDNTKGN